MAESMVVLLRLGCVLTCICPDFNFSFLFFFSPFVRKSQQLALFQVPMKICRTVLLCPFCIPFLVEFDLLKSSIFIIVGAVLFLCFEFCVAKCYSNVSLHEFVAGFICDGKVSGLGTLFLSRCRRCLHAGNPLAALHK